MPTLTLQPNSSAGVDTFLSEESPTTNFGANGVLQIGATSTQDTHSRALLKFDISSLPADTVITTATLTLIVSTDNRSGSPEFRAYRVTQTGWAEGAGGSAGATWLTYDATPGTAWATAGGDYTTDLSSGQSSSIAAGILSIGGLADICDYARDSASGLVHLLVRLETEPSGTTSYVEVHSSDSATASSRPQLSVVYEYLTADVAWRPRRRSPHWTSPR